MRKDEIGSNRLKASLLIMALVIAAPWCVQVAIDVQTDIRIAQANESSLDDSFLEEFANLRGFSEIRYMGEAGVCSFESALAPEPALRELRGGMEEKGWSAIPTGDSLSASFFKSKGAYRWAYVSCGQVEGATVFVCHVA